MTSIPLTTKSIVVTGASASSFASTVIMKSPVYRSIRTTTFSGTPDTIAFSTLGTGSHWIFISTTGGGTIGTFFFSADTVTGNYYVAPIASNNITMVISGSNLSWTSANTVTYTGHISWLSMGVGA